ncbi:hypothetical protein IFR05_003674 [Cadophora sp. M221]|nr:hypothetical protein IFR05_003674 [Cadophora sp. M221]
MHFTTSILGLFLATSGLVAALPQPGINVQITVLDETGGTKQPMNENFAKEIHSFGGGDRVHHPETGAEYDTLLQTPDKLIVVDFKADWCGPCRAMAPLLSQYSNDYSEAVFIAVDIDKLRNHPEVSGIRSVPTFKFRKNGSPVYEFSGANGKKLKDAIERNL